MDESTNNKKKKMEVTIVTQSIWLSSSKDNNYESLKQSIDTEICIVGGGISGIYTAYLLTFEGLNVTLLEGRESLVNGTTGYSTGKLTIQHGDGYSKLLEQFSLEEIKVYVQANQKAIENALKVASPSSYNQVNSTLYATTNEGKKKLEKEYDSYKKLGITGYFDEPNELPFSILKSLTIKNEHQINPVLFAQHFAKLAKDLGANIYTSSRVTHIDKSEKTITIENGANVSYKKLILCTHYPIDSIRGLYTVKLQIKRSYLLASPYTKTLKGQYLSVDEDSRTFLTTSVNDQSYLIYGGHNHLAGTVEHTNEIYKKLEKEMVDLFNVSTPQLQWSAQDIFTPDLIPYVGQLTKNEDSVFIATGFKKWGLSNSLVAGEILVNELKGLTHPAKHLYSPSRSNFGEKLTKILVHTGFITTNYIGGHLTRMNTPRCTHMGCKTRWNDGDQTWDCPCHGSRYSSDGTVLEGPAVYPLKCKKKRK